MKPIRIRLILILTVIIVAVVIFMIGASYYQYVSKCVFEDNANHLQEVYGQVDHYFLTFLNQNWGNLGDWDYHLRVETADGVKYYLNNRQSNWGFSDFYFLSSDGKYITPSGETGFFDMGEEKQQLNAGQKVMFNADSPSGQPITVFAIPVPEGDWNNFKFTSIGISYTNADMVKTLDVNAFSNKSVCFITEPNGNVLLSTQQGGSVFDNYLAYLKGASNLTSTQLEKLQMDWLKGETGVLPCKIGKVDYYLYYQKLGYQNDVLIGVVPTSAASANLLAIQHATIRVLLIIFLLIGGIIIAFLIIAYRQKTKMGAVELKYRELMFDLLSMNVNDIFIMLDADTLKIDYISPNIERLLGISEQDARNNIRLVGGANFETKNVDYKKIFSEIPLHGSFQCEREHINNTTGEQRWFREFVYHENIEDTEKFLIVLSDRTQEKNMNQHLVELWEQAKDANEAKSTFLANMSHDIRTPMNAIIGFSGLIEKEPDNPEKVRTYIKKINASSSHLLSLINDVLDMSKIESGKASINMEEFSLPELLENLNTIVLPLAQAKRQKFMLHVNGHPTERLIGDKLRLNQILFNLLSNAVKYTEDGGNINLYVQQLQLQLQDSTQTAKLRFVIEDNGMGMGEEFIKHIFDPFTREQKSTINKIQGTGLGMAITKNLVTLMGGDIHVQSKLGEGSIFTVELKFPVAKNDDAKNYLKDKGIKRVLIVDDEEDACKNIATIFNDADVECVCNTSAQQAIDTLKAAKTNNNMFDVVLLDWKMPETDGINTTKQIRDEIDKDVPIILLTGYDRSDIEEESREAGIDAFLSKPFFLSSFRHILDSVLTSKIKPIAIADENVLEGMRFLVAEDNDLNAEVLFDTLEIEGALFERAVNGKEAVEKFLNSEPGYYDMILMDVQMPVMNGYEATRAIRASKHPSAEQIPIIAMTANAFSEDVREALNSGMSAHLAKPIYIDAMIGLINEFNNKKNNGSED